MMRYFYFLVFSVGFLLNTSAQNLSAKLLDNEQGNPVPFATIKITTNFGVMSNEEGVFEFEKPKGIKKDSIEISSLGFKTKKISIKDSLPKLIYLDFEIYKIAPVVLGNNKISAKDIIKNVKLNLSKNYQESITKNSFFVRETYAQKFKKFRFKVRKTTFKGINQSLFDSIAMKFPKNFTSVSESYGDVFMQDSNVGKSQLKKVMLIESKHQKASVKDIQAIFLKTLKENTKSNSYLVIKSGIIRLDKTESIDSITKSMAPRKTKKDGVKMRKGAQKYRNSTINNLLKNIYINEDSDIDVLNKSYRYEFEKIGYVELENALAYIIEFKPKGRAKYKGKLYINMENYAIVKSEMQGAKKVFDKKLNMFGVKANELTYKNTVIFSKEANQKYQVKYIKTESTQGVGIDRPIKIIERNKHVKGKNTQNKVSFQMTVLLHNYDKKEIVFNDTKSTSRASYSAFKPKLDFKVGRFTSYNKEFWKGYQIMTPEKAIQNLKIED